ncbi:hypothetical protein F2Q68_00035151 [Brassica cretica]|uniref:Uncharacterized protein n=1 Tax=Brassica cretica TaxID=69181 RepID=A0A8S9H5L5_BRACR|nr:hypothetical protein F2Q68_00035151 [Brassica cretica]
MRSRLIIGRDELDRNEGNRSRTLPSSPSSSSVLRRLLLCVLSSLCRAMSSSPVLAVR